MPIVIAVGQRADFGIRSARVADAYAAGAFDQRLGEAIRDAALDEDARDRQALLAIVDEDAEQGAVERRIEIRIVDKDVSRLSAHFHDSGIERRIEEASLDTWKIRG